MIAYWVSSADKFCKQFGPRSGQTKRRACSRSYLFDTQMVFLKEFFEKVDFEKISRRQKKTWKISQGAMSYVRTMVRMLYQCSLIWFYTLLCSMSLISPNSAVKSIIFFPNFGRGPFPKLLEKAPTSQATAMGMVGQSVLLTTLFPGQAWTRG